MDFDRLPNEIITQLFSYLPFTERVRLAIVNKTFRLMSSISISQTKFLNLKDPIFRHLTPESLSILLDSCYQSLERIKFYDLKYVTGFAETFSHYSCPRLVEIDLRNALMEDKYFEDFLTWNKNLKSILGSCVWGGPTISLSFSNVIFEKLEKLSCRSNDSTFRSLIGRCPNLRYLKTAVDADKTAEGFDQFLCTCPKLETIIFGGRPEQNFRFNYLVHFWNLTSLHTLVIGDGVYNNFDKVVDDDLIKISKCFPRLEILQLSSLQNLTNDGLKALAALKHLRKLTLLWKDRFHVHVDESLRWLADCDRLEEVQINANLHPVTLITFIRFCPDLRLLSVNAIEIRTTVAAVHLVKFLYKFCNTILTIRISDRQCASLLASKDFLRQVEESFENKNGGVITFEKGEFLSYFGEI